MIELFALAGGLFLLWNMQRGKSDEETEERQSRRGPGDNESDAVAYTPSARKDARRPHHMTRLDNGEIVAVRAKVANDPNVPSSNLPGGFIEEKGKQIKPMPYLGLRNQRGRPNSRLN